LAAIDGALGVYKEALEYGISDYLVGRPSDVVLRRFNKPFVPVRNLELASDV
jgi:glutamate-1-semialdehyde 2,1-aminomutase